MADISQVEEEYNDEIIKSMDSTDLLFRDIFNRKVLPREQQRTLLIRAKSGDIKARNTLVEHNLKLIVSIAKRYSNRGLSLSDLISEGSMGLIKAIKNFDLETEYAFSTYATCWIRQFIARAIQEQSSIIRIPVHLNEKLAKYNNFVSRFRLNYGC